VDRSHFTHHDCYHLQSDIPQHPPLGEDIISECMVDDDVEIVLNCTSCPPIRLLRVRNEHGWLYKTAFSTIFISTIFWFRCEWHVIKPLKRIFSGKKFVTNMEHFSLSEEQSKTRLHSSCLIHTGMPSIPLGHPLFHSFLIKFTSSIKGQKC